MSGFGEISEPSTRTALEDWDDNILNHDTFSVLSLKEKVVSPEEINTFLILEGRYLHDCVKDQHELEHVNSIPEVDLHLYKTKGMNDYICVIDDYKLIHSSEIVEILKEYITRSTDVIALLTKPLVEYMVAESVTKDYIIRSLHTSHKLSSFTSYNFAKLEQPNMIAGVAAGGNIDMLKLLQLKNT